jgi:hypothetical protein
MGSPATIRKLPNEIPTATPSATIIRSIIALAYDTGGVTTSTVTVPLVAALGLGLASTIEGRNPIIDGFGLIATATPSATIIRSDQT